ncbi:MAG: subclass B1 metallo-beta-lactamase [Lewinellaceae bacterium]|nr:subclass B1 metallo-beta-lactamase [Lewinellaceae bacterium]
MSKSKGALKYSIFLVLPLKLNLKTPIAAILLLGLLSCRTQKDIVLYESDNLKVERLTKSTFRHISYLLTEDFGKVSCNGMIVADNNEALIFDTPTNDADSRELIDWVEKNLKCKVTGVVVTHFHNDCLGGLAEFHGRQIPSYASFRTIELAKSNNLQVPQTGFEDSLALKVGDEKVINEFLGEGHTIDNIVSYFPAEKVLFGGCLIKAMGANKGYLGDANTNEWANTVQAVKAKYGKAKVIIPGHGDPGNSDLLTYTIELFKFVFPNLLSGQGIPEEVSQEIQRRISLEINPGISIGLLLPSGEAKFYNYGQYNDHANQKADSLTLYEIGSVTKTFTATLAGLHLKDAFGAYLSDIFIQTDNPSLGQITLSDLRNHLSGMPRLSEQFSPRDWSDPYNGYSDSILYEELQNVKPDTVKRWSYSNFGYGILGKALEIATRRDFEDLMGDLLLKAGMKHTFLTHQIDSLHRLAQPTNIGTGNSYWNFTGPSRYAGGLLSCTKDLIHYLQYQQANNPLFYSDSINGLVNTGIVELGKDHLFYKDGWLVFKPDGHTEILFHNGGTGGFTAFLAFNKNTKTGVAVLSNSVSLADDIGLKLIYPDFPLKRPGRTIAYELADEIDKGNVENLAPKYNQLKREGYPDNIIDIYWLERFFFGRGDYSISDQLSDIMVQVLPDDWEVFDIKGQNLERLEKYEEAVKVYRKALELNPENGLLKDKIKRCAAISD